MIMSVTVRDATPAEYVLLHVPEREGASGSAWKHLWVGGTCLSVSRPREPSTPAGVPRVNATIADADWETYEAILVPEEEFQHRGRPDGSKRLTLGSLELVFLRPRSPRARVDLVKEAPDAPHREREPQNPLPVGGAGAPPNPRARRGRPLESQGVSTRGLLVSGPLPSPLRYHYACTSSGVPGFDQPRPGPTSLLYSAHANRRTVAMDNLHPLRGAFLTFRAPQRRSHLAPSFIAPPP